jgi:hypothetical protein
LPFAFRDTNKSSASVAEEGSIQLPLEPSEITSPAAAAVIPGRMNSPYMDNMTPVGSFYGRRDFENRQDVDDLGAGGVGDNLKRQPSMVGAVLERIKSKKTTKTSDSSDTDLDDDEEDSD